VTIFFGLATLLVLWIVAVAMIFSGRNLERRLNALLQDQLERIHHVEQSLERLKVESTRVLPS
jgi:hypothetical protein